MRLPRSTVSIGRMIKTILGIAAQISGARQADIKTRYCRQRRRPLKSQHSLFMRLWVICTCEHKQIRMHKTSLDIQYLKAREFTGRCPTDVLFGTVRAVGISTPIIGGVLSTTTIKKVGRTPFICCMSSPANVRLAYYGRTQMDAENSHEISPSNYRSGCALSRRCLAPHYFNYAIDRDE